MSVFIYGEMCYRSCGVKAVAVPHLEQVGVRHVDLCDEEALDDERGEHEQTHVNVFVTGKPAREEGMPAANRMLKVADRVAFVFKCLP